MTNPRPLPPASDAAALQSVANHSTEVPVESIYFILHKILSSKYFCNSKRHREFLRFTVTETLAGRASNLKEYVLGVDVFGRQDSFDPHVSPIVRVGASRVRAKLQAYYNGEGQSDPVTIEMPRGSYVPVFRHRRDLNKKNPAENDQQFWRRSKWILAILAFVLLLSVGGLSSYAFIARRDLRVASAPLGKITSVAVAPFRSTVPEKEVEYINDWLTDELISRLSEEQSLRVVAHSPVLQLTRAVERKGDMGGPLGADVVLQGTTERIADHARIRVELVDVRTGYHRWSDLYDCALKDVFAVQHEISRAIVRTLQNRPTYPSFQSAATGLEAYNLYLDGIYQVNHQSYQGLMNAVEYFRKSIAIDPHFALAHSRLANAYIGLTEWGEFPASQGLVQAGSSADKALGILPDSAEAHASLGLVNSLRWRWTAAEHEFGRAVERDPGNGEVREKYAVNYLLPMRRLNEAIEQIQKAHVLPPMSVATNVNLCRVYYCNGDYEQAIDQCRRALAIEPSSSDAYFLLASALAQKSLLAEAASAIESIGPPGDNARIVAFRGYISGLRGRVQDAQTALHQLDELSARKHVSSYDRSLVYLGLKDSGRAMKFLEQAYEERDPALIYLAVDPKWGNLRSAPRFRALLEKVGLLR
jgi:TolB-like protein/Flp pilus assembly protein TadD